VRAAVDLERQRLAAAPGREEPALDLAAVALPAALDRRSIRLGIDYLLRTQVADGSWVEPEVTGTGFPRVFYLRYDMYRNNFPLMALAAFRKARMGGQVISNQ